MTPFERTHWGRNGLLILLICALCVAVVVGISYLIVANSDQGPLEPTPVPTLEPTIGPTAPATPTVAFDPNPQPVRGSMLEMLGYAPDRLAEGSLPLSDIAQYADIQRWMEAQGVPIPTGPHDPAWDSWQRELESLAIPEVISSRGTDAAWIDNYGFGLHDIHQILAVGSAPDFVLVIRGDFEADQLHAAWVESGYQAVRVDGVTIWSLYPGDSVDLSAPASRPALGNMNNIVLLDDGTLIATSRLSRLQQTVRAIDGQSPTLARNPEIRRMLSPGTESELLVTGVLQQGTALESLPVPTPVATPAGEGTPQPVVELPRATMVLTGLHLPAGRSPAVLIHVVNYEDAEAATLAMFRAERELSSGRSMVTGAPYARRVIPDGMRVIATDGDDTLLFMRLRPMKDVSDWRTMIEQRDFGYVMWPRQP